MKPIINCDKFIDGKLVNSNNIFLMAFMNPNVVTRTIKFQMQKIMEDWANVKLNKNFISYGIRRYTRGAVLLQHVDKIPSHIISVILQIDQKVDEDWPLTLVDHKGIFMLIATHNLGRNGVLVLIKEILARVLSHFQN